MSKRKISIELDDNIITLFEQKAQEVNYSAKQLMEFFLNNMSFNLEEPTEEYKAMMDEMLDKRNRGELITYDLEEVLLRKSKKINYIHNKK